MKKILGIIVLGLFLSGNVYASSDKNYLICKVKATDTTKNSGKMIKFITDVVSIINVNYISINKKKDQEKIEIVIYEHTASKVWFKSKPDKLLSFLPKSQKAEKIEYKNGHFLYTIKDTLMDGALAKKTFDIYKKDKWVIEGTDFFDFGNNDILDYPFKGDCEEYSKEEFVKLRKKGIK